MNINDSQRLDFLEKWETSSHKTTWFTILTQHVHKADYPTLRSFCDYAIGLEDMLDSNKLDVIAYHHLPHQLQEIIINVWETEKRVLTDDEKVSLQEEANAYWEKLYELEEENKDK